MDNNQKVFRTYMGHQPYIRFGLQVFRLRGGTLSFKYRTINIYPWYFKVRHLFCFFRFITCVAVEMGRILTDHDTLGEEISIGLRAFTHGYDFYAGKNDENKYQVHLRFRVSQYCFLLKMIAFQPNVEFVFTCMQSRRMQIDERIYRSFGKTVVCTSKQPFLL